MPVERVNSTAPRRSQPPHFPAVAQFHTSSQRDSPAVQCASLRAMRWCSQTVDSISGLEHQGLNSLAIKYGGTMKSRISLFLLTFALAASSTLTAHAACNNLTIKGTYAFTIHGTVFLPGRFTLLIDGIDKVTFHAYGNLTHVHSLATNRTLPPHSPPC